MKKIVVFLISIVVIITAIFFNWYTNSMKESRLVKSYNSEYEIYTGREITGVDLTTVINKAIDNNEKYSISKNDKGTYVNDNKYCTKIYIKVSEDFYPMEAFEQVGMLEFTRAYGSAKFKSTNIEYNKDTGRISKINFEIIE